MKPRNGARGDRGPSLWTRGLWPPLGGTVTAVGVFGASRAYGMVGLLMAFVLLSPFAIAATYGLSDEFGIRHSRVVPLGLAETLIVLVLLGLGELFGGYGLLVFTVTGLSSPAALRLHGHLRQLLRRHQDLPPASDVLLDPIMLERRFNDIVRGLDDSG
jgi:hypothetical protein